MTSTLPVEIWQIILEHALIFHPFFSIDPFTDFTENRYDAALHDWLKTPGWGEEFCRQRLVLRQVCHSWRTFVDRPEIKLRYRRMEDTYTTEASVVELMQARRIQAPSSFYAHLNKDALEEILRSAQAMSETQGDGHAIFKAEIITHLPLHLSQRILDSPSSLFPHLKSLHLDFAKILPGGRWDGFAKISKHFPDTEFLCVNADLTVFSSEAILHLQSLRTLVITSSYSRLEGLQFNHWSLPSLCNLKIRTFRDVAKLRNLFGALPQLGHRLKVLDVDVARVDRGIDDLMPRLWSDCPRLESLRIPLSLLMAHPPTHTRHPLRYLVHSQGTPRGSGWAMTSGWLDDNFTSTLISFCNALPSLLVVQDSHDWTSVTFRDLENNNDDEPNFRMKLDQETCRKMVETAVRINALNMVVRFEDANGKTWEEI